MPFTREQAELSVAGYLAEKVVLPTLIGTAFANMATGMVDSVLESTRVYWRKKYFEATDDDARDPRPWIDVAADRERRQRNGEMR
jgi:hypothetical protein